MRDPERAGTKGALLILVWLGETIRPTRDADLLGFGDLSPESFEQILKDVCTVQVEPDGLEYLISPIDVSPIREADDYGGTRGRAAPFRPAWAMRDCTSRLTSASE